MDPKQQSHKTVAFIGGGNMAFAIAAGLTRSGWSSGKLRIADPSADQRQRFKDWSVGIRTFENNLEAVAGADVVILAVKPQIMAAAATSLATAEWQSDVVIISIAAGIDLKSLENLFGPHAIVRSMPNQGALIGEGATALVANTQCNPEQRGLAETIMRATGHTQWLEQESLMDTVTAVSGSGPAYFYAMMEALIAAGVDHGLPADTARELVTATALGAARLAAEPASSIALLRERVTSPGGTTAAGLASLANDEFGAIIESAVAAARKRSIELANH